MSLIDTQISVLLPLATRGCISCSDLVSQGKKRQNVLTSQVFTRNFLCISFLLYSTLFVPTYSFFEATERKWFASVAILGQPTLRMCYLRPKGKYYQLLTLGRHRINGCNFSTNQRVHLFLWEGLLHSFFFTSGLQLPQEYSYILVPRTFTKRNLLRCARLTFLRHFI